MRATKPIVVCLSALALLLGSGCDKKDSGPAGKAEGAKSAKAGATGESLESLAKADLFKLIPADTPYVVAALRPVPRSFSEPVMKRFMPSLKDFTQDIGTQMIADGVPEQVAKLIEGFTGEIMKDPTLAGLEKLGMSAEPKFAIYGIGVLPAMRLELKDSKAFQATLDRVFAKAGFKPTIEKLGTVSYMAFVADETTIAVAVTDKELVVGVAPTKTKQLVFSLLFGQKKPAKSMADVSTLADIAKQNSFGGYSVGYIDANILKATFLGDAQGTNADIFKSVGGEIPELPAECKAEISSLVALMPRIIFGYDELSAKGAKASIIFSLKPGLAKELSGLRAGVPGLTADPSGKPLLTFGVAIDVQKTMTYLTTKLATITAAPYKCPLLADLNGFANQVAEAMQAPIPPVVKQIKGFNAIVENADVGAGMPENIRATAVFSIDKPEELVTMAGGMVPALANLNLKSDGKAVPLPAGLPIPPMIESPHLAMKGQSLAASIGKGMEASLSKTISAKPDAKQPLFVLAYDTGKFMEKVNAAAKATLTMLPPEEKAKIERSLKVNEAVGKFLGLMSYSAYLTDKGLVVRQQIEFK